MAPQKPKPRPAPKTPRPKAPAAAARFPIVGIGASAGGLEAFTRLLENLSPETGMGFVLVQHLSPDHKSLLSAILSRSTPMPVIEVRQGTRVKKNHVYVMPPNTAMSIVNGVLLLTPRREQPSPHLAVDDFLISLADDRRELAIGVVLSGTGSDGAEGLRKIKAEGGLTFAQDPRSAKFEGMPNRAIAVDHVDFVLTPESIAHDLLKISRLNRLPPASASNSASASPPEEFPAPEDAELFGELFHLLKQSTGVDFSQYKFATLHRRIARRMVLHGIETLRAYLRYLAENLTERTALHNDFLINVTRFFRDPVTFACLQAKAFPSLLSGAEARPGTTIRVWVPGCATGEEAYSIAISLLELQDSRSSHIPVQIFATDISNAVIEKARAGNFSEHIRTHVSEERLQRFFLRTEDGYRIGKAVRDVCVFSRHDLLKDPPFSKIDFISCRNVLIYLGAPLQNRLMSIFHYALKPTGLLMLGNSETVGVAADLFALADKKHKIYYRKSALLQAPPAFAPQHGAPSFPNAAYPQTKTVLKTSFGPTTELDRLLGGYAPAAVVIDSALNILHFRGHTGPYLEPNPGEASFSLLKMAREGLMPELGTALRAAQRHHRRERREGLSVKSDDGLRRVDIEVMPLTASEGEGENCFVIVFTDAPRAATAKGKANVKKDRESASPRLQRELEATREYLQSVIADNEASRNELQSLNEELQSTNEEMETAKEELQSTNEELSTVNDELQNRNHQLSQANSDLNNLFGGINIPVVIIDNDLRIRRFTPAALQLFNVIASDVGRPLTDITCKLQIPLMPLIEGSIKEVSLKESEVQDQDGRWYLLRVRPYKTQDLRMEGAVITLLDIDRLKSNENRLQDALDFNAAVIETIREPLVVLDTQLRVVKANTAFYEKFRTTRELTEKNHFYDLGGGQWNLPQLRTLLEDILPRQSLFRDFKVEQDFSGIGRKTMLLNARQVRRDGALVSLILLAIEDLTDTNG